MIPKRLAAEAIGTFWLVLGGCGTAVLGSAGYLGVSIAFGLTVVTMAYAVGPISGCHLNPAITLGLATAGRFPKKDVVGYWIAQVAGAVIASLVILVIAQGREGFKLTPDTMAANGYGDHSPGKYSLLSGLVTEIVMTCLFVLVILGATAKKAAPGFAGLAIGLCLTLVHLSSINVTNTSVNPARSTGPALVAFGWALEQLWLFWVAPLIGAVVAGFAWTTLFGSEDAAEAAPTSKA
jgi:aquaporin Z